MGYRIRKVCSGRELHTSSLRPYSSARPQIPVCCYYGTRDARAELRRTELHARSDGIDPKDQEEEEQPKPARRKSKGGSKANSNARRKSAKQAEPADKEKKGIETTEDMFARVKKSFPVVVTTYEIVMRDSKPLGAYDWGYIIVDEGKIQCCLIDMLRLTPRFSRAPLEEHELQVRSQQLFLKAKTDFFFAAKAYSRN